MLWGNERTGHLFLAAQSSPSPAADGDAPPACLHLICVVRRGSLKGNYFVAEAVDIV